MADYREINHQWYQHFSERTMTVIIENDSEEWVVPVKYEVCDTCSGRGKHVNPSIDSHGISAEEFAEDPDFAQEYWRGTYDVPCAECHGQRVSITINEARMTDNELKRVTKHIREFYDYQHEMARERKMGY